MKIALCLYGQPRFYKQVLPIWNKIITELNVDVFIHTWYGEDRAGSITNSNELITDFIPKEIGISSLHKFMELIPAGSKFENQSYHGMQQAYSISNSIKLQHDYSEMYGGYDLIIKSRMDIELQYPDALIQLIKEPIHTDLYVCSNHWPDGVMFDDNLMIGTPELIEHIFLDYFNTTINTIRSTHIIPGGEQNIVRQINQCKFLDNIRKRKELDFNLLYISKENLILNQNE